MHGPRLVVAFGTAPAHAFLRAEAARFHGVAASHVVLVRECPRCGSDAHGRPRLLATASVRRPAHVSLARAGGLSVVAVTDAGDVGVDVEADGAAGFAGFGDVALHPAELAASATDPTRAWVRKEALLKACGLGLTVDPSTVLIGDDGLEDWGSTSPRPDRVWSRDLDVPGHVASVVVLPPSGVDVAGLTAELRAATT